MVHEWNELYQLCSRAVYGLDYWWSDFWSQLCSTPWAERSCLVGGCDLKSHVVRTNSLLTLCRNLCTGKGLLVALQVSSFCWVWDWHCMLQRIITWDCGGCFEINPYLGVRPDRWGGRAGCCKSLGTFEGIGTRKEKQLLDAMWILCPTQPFLPILFISSSIASKTTHCMRQGNIDFIAMV